jgi:uncharacterized protein
MRRQEFKRALITGASLGLGKAFARECAARGMDLLLVALPGSGLSELSESISRERGVSARYLEADLTESSTMNDLLAMIRAERLPVDLLVNNAGIGSVGSFEDSSVEGHEAAIRLNAIALVRLTRLMLSEFEGRGRAQVLNVASLGAFFPMPTLSVYSATKSFVLNFSLALREELSGRVGVSVLCPNAFSTTEEVADYAASLGLAARLACLSPARIASEALDGAERDRAVIVPGLFNRALGAVGRLLPRALVMKAIRRYWGGFGAAAATAARAA